MAGSKRKVAGKGFLKALNTSLDKRGKEKMADRLLDDNQLNKASNFFEDDGIEREEIGKLLKAQDLKTAAAVNAVWVKWGEDWCTKHKHSMRYRKYICPECWQESKKEVGL